MKFQCPGCERLVELERFRVEGGVLAIECSKCGLETRVQSRQGTATAVGAPQLTPPTSLPRVALVSSPAASNVVTLKTAATDAIQRAAASAAAAFSIPLTVCPKCIAKRGSGAACTQCGVVFAQYARKVIEPPAWLSTAWLELLGDWGNDARHDRIRASANNAQALAELARLYRLRLADCADDPWAVKARDEIVRLASIAALQPTTPQERQLPRVKVAAVGVLALAVVGVLVYLISKIQP